MSKDAKAADLNFEDALARLESIVETMEAGELPLEQLLARYEEGARLVKFCQERLSAAELRIQQLDPNAAPCAPSAPLDDEADLSAPAENLPAGSH
jgi:exodeoxyribonuclease VII small subunit